MRSRVHTLLAAWCLFASGIAGPALTQDAEDPTAVARRAASGRLAKAEEVALRAQGLEGHADFAAATSRDGQISSRLTQGKNLLAAARGALETAKRRGTVTAWKDAGALAGGAVKNYEEGMARAQREIRRIEAERAPPPPPPPPPADPPAPTGEEGAAGNEPATGKEPGAGGKEASEPSGAAGSPPPPPRSSGLPSSLVRGAERFFAGDYAGVLENLDPSRYRSRKARAHAHLLRAASHYSQFLLGGETDYGQRAAAIEDIAACRQLAATLEPPAEYFSPRFREFFVATR